MSVMVPPAGMLVAGVNTSMGATAAPAVLAPAIPPEVMEVKVIPVTATVGGAIDV